jgi:hypothetical protein
MLRNMHKSHKGKDKYYERTCLLCGHDNAPPRAPERIDGRTQANRERHARKLAAS